VLGEKQMVEKVSRSEQKRLFRQTDAVAVELAELTNKDLKIFPGEDEVKTAIMDCRGLKGGARKRQIKYLSKVLRQFSMDEIYKFLETRKGSELKGNQLFHQAERWRDILINEAVEIHEDCRRNQIVFEPDWQSDIIADLLTELPSLQETDIRKTVYQYARSRNVMHYRELFRMLKAAVDMEDRAKLQRKGESVS
jgi:ribosome-associated protein